MSDDVKGVLVRLPMSEKHLNEFHHTVMYCEEEAALRNIGTPVTDGELYPIGYIGEDAIGGLACGIYQTAYIFRDKDADHHNDIALTRMSEALAKLAEKDVEIGRYRDVLSKISSVTKDQKYTETYSALKFCETEALKALKGPEV